MKMVRNALCVLGLLISFQGFAAEMDPAEIARTQSGGTDTTEVIVWDTEQDAVETSQEQLLRLHKETDIAALRGLIASVGNVGDQEKDLSLFYGALIAAAHGPDSKYKEIVVALGPLGLTKAYFAKKETRTHALKTYTFVNLETRTSKKGLFRPFVDHTLRLMGDTYEDVVILLGMKDEAQAKASRDAYMSEVKQAAGCPDAIGAGSNIGAEASRALVRRTVSSATGFGHLAVARTAFSVPVEEAIREDDIDPETAAALDERVDSLQRDEASADATAGTQHQNSPTDELDQLD